MTATTLAVAVVVTTLAAVVTVEFTFPVSVPRPEVAHETPKRFWHQNEFPTGVFQAAEEEE